MHCILTNVLIIRCFLLDAQDFPLHAFPLLLQPSVGAINAFYRALQQLKGCSVRLNKLYQQGVKFFHLIPHIISNNTQCAIHRGRRG